MKTFRKTGNYWQNTRTSMHFFLLCYILFSTVVLKTSMLQECPHSSQWKLAAKSFCNTSHAWFNCLYDESNMTYTHFCRNQPDFQRPGYKFIIRGSLDGALCNTNKFQPFKFWTNSSSDCVFKKTNCIEEGQVVFDKGNSTSDRKCRCDYTSGYVFVVHPKSNCYCDPELEDCSCYLLPCQQWEVITPDYTCIQRNKWTGDFKCPLITTTSETDKTAAESSGNQLPTSIPFLDSCFYLEIVITALIAFVVTLGICFTLCGSKVWSMSRNFIDTKVTKKVEEVISSNRNESTRAKLCLKVNYQDIVTTVKNDEIVDVLKHHNNYLNQIQIEQIQSCLGKIKKNMKLLEIIWNDGIGGFNSFVSALENTGSYQTLLDKIKETKEDTHINLDALDTEVEGLFNEQISKAKRDNFESHLIDWQEEDKVFVETEAEIFTANLLKTNNYVIVFGGLGFGKTAILRHIALKLLNEENYDIIPKVSSPVDIIEYLHPDRKQVFVVDDINNEPANSWSLQTNEILKQLKAKKGIRNY